MLKYRILTKLHKKLRNARIYNLISIPQIKRLLLGDAMISSRGHLHNGSQKEKKKYGKIESNKTKSKILPFIRIFILNNKAVFCHAFLG